MLTIFFLQEDKTFEVLSYSLMVSYMISFYYFNCEEVKHWTLRMICYFYFQKKKKKEKGEKKEAVSATEALAMVLQEKKLSNKINYKVLILNDSIFLPVYI